MALEVWRRACKEQRPEEDHESNRGIIVVREAGSQRAAAEEIPGRRAVRSACGGPRFARKPGGQEFQYSLKPGTPHRAAAERGTTSGR